MTAENRHLVREETIALMNRAPVLVNTSRGGLVDLDAVLAALDDGRLAGVALDVTDPEPLPPRTRCGRTRARSSRRTWRTTRPRPRTS